MYIFYETINKCISDTWYNDIYNFGKFGWKQLQNNVKTKPSFFANLTIHGNSIENALLWKFFIICKICHDIYLSMTCQMIFEVNCDFW